MTIQYASDLHLEFPDNKVFLDKNPLQAVGNILLLAGDIVPFSEMEKHQDFFSYVSDHFEQTYWVPGNHEYYYFDLAEKCGIMHENIRSNVHLINNTALEYGGVHLIFTTLWSNIPPTSKWEVERRMGDFQVVKYQGKRFNIELATMLHHESVAFLKSVLPKVEKSVVVSHHLPTFMNYPPEYKGDMLNEAFATELSPLLHEMGPDYWIFGHHHENVAPFSIGKTKLRTNQLGYVKYREHHTFRTNALL